jgi:hypothetical protein
VREVPSRDCLIILLPLPLPLLPPLPSECHGNSDHIQQILTHHLYVLLFSLPLRLFERLLSSFLVSERKAHSRNNSFAMAPKIGRQHYLPPPPGYSWASTIAAEEEKEKKKKEEEEEKGILPKSAEDAPPVRLHSSLVFEMPKPADWDQLEPQVKLQKKRGD